MKNRTLPYGYCCVDGIITAHSEESAVVSDICTAYLAGKSLLTIAELLNERQIEYTTIRISSDTSEVLMDNPKSSPKKQW